MHNKFLSQIAKNAERFLYLSATIEGARNPNAISPAFYESERSSLQDSIARIVSVLLSDAVNSVKQTLIEQSAAELAVFFGRMKG